MYTIPHQALAGLPRFKRLAIVAACLASPWAAQAAPVTFDMAATLFGTDGAPPAGRLTGSIDYDAETGVFSRARLQVVLSETGALLDLIDIDPDFDAIGKETKPIVVSGDVKGESLDKDHKDTVEMRFPGPFRPGAAIVDFSGSFIDRFPGADTVTYSLRGSATLAVAEPATLALLAVGLWAAAFTRRFKPRAG
jgi:PEP-CTERM motif